jgi:hypothetical protein
MLPCSHRLTAQCLCSSDEKAIKFHSLKTKLPHYSKYNCTDLWFSSSRNNPTRLLNIWPRKLLAIPGLFRGWIRARPCGSPKHYGIPLEYYCQPVILRLSGNGFQKGIGGRIWDFPTRLYLGCRGTVQETLYLFQLCFYVMILHRASCMQFMGLTSETVGCCSAARYPKHAASYTAPTAFLSWR